ncbi:Motile_Sperm domain-containing protein [Cephalotus follicularis]|uniref:Motile_Sperm domain-containing protein n=1 Tax=Cephalotus follicularis TaxID=3775 RepID=A0A1Q3B841_CEPFO|nr:Motile_Sperm domain-containing protein [Cephalotus follicularis]
MTSQLVEIQPRELKFIFELKKQSSCSARLTNNTYQYVAFKVKTTSPKKYSVRPNVGVIKPKSTCEFIVTMQAQRSVPPDMVCKDKFLIQTTVVPDWTTEEDIDPSTFAKDDKNYIEENKLKVALVEPPHSPVLSPMNGTLKQGPAYESSVLKEPVLTQDADLKSTMYVVNGQEFKPAKNAELNPMEDDGEALTPAKNADLQPIKDAVYSNDLRPANDAVSIEELKLAKDSEFNLSKDSGLKTRKTLEELKFVKDMEEMKSKLNELESQLSEAGVIISKLTEERRVSIRERKILKEEMVLLKSRADLRRVQVGFPLLFVCMVALVSVVLGYLSHL